MIDLVHPRRGTRKWKCTNCGREQSEHKAVISTRCRKCNKPMRPQKKTGRRVRP